MNHEKLLARLAEPKLDDLLADWRWLVQEEASLIAVTAMGDMVLRRNDGSIWFLDTIEGNYNRIADSENDYLKLLTSRDFRRKYMQYHCVLCLVESGVELDTNQCYSPNVPPHLGGELDEENLKPTDVYVHFSVSGQLWEQTKDLKPGAKVRIEVIPPPGERDLLSRVFGFGKG